MRTETRRPHLAYAPGLDGLRAIAVLAVIAYHADVPFLPGGFLGVDVFFVLSGFLITSLLLAEHRATGRLHLPSFWARRGRRLLPALLVLLAVLCLWATLWADPIAQDRFRGDAFAGLGYFANWHFAATGTSYFDAFSAASPVRHLWSLAIEEQFYLVWPLVVAGVLSIRRFGRQALLTLAVVGAVVSAVLMATGYDGGDPSRIYYGTDTHAFGLLFGAALAVIAATWTRSERRDGSERPLRALGWVGAGGLVALFAAFALLPDDQAITYQGGIVAASLVTVPLVFAASRPGVVSRVLSWKPLVAIGLVSYGLYLWHWPIWTVLTPERIGVDGAALELARVGILVAVTLASYAIVERPIRRGFLRGWPIRVLAPAAVGGLAVAVIATTVAPPVFTPSVAIPAAAADGPSNTIAGSSFSNPTAAPAKPGIVVVGDSTGGSAFQGFDAVLGDTYHVVPASFVPKVAGNFCPLDLDMDGLRGPEGEVKEGAPEPACDWASKWPRLVHAYRPKVAIVMFALWDAQAHRVRGQWLQPGTDAWERHLTARAQCAIHTLSSDGAHVLFVLQPPTIQLPDHWRNNWNRLLTDIARADPARASVVDVSDAVMSGGAGFRWDGVHYTPEGANALAHAMRGAVDEARAMPPSAPLPAPPSCPAGSMA